MRRTKIVATLGPASESETMLRQLIEAGMDVARMNFSHGSHDDHAERIKRVRAQAAAAGKPVAILQDLQGPKIRTGVLAGHAPVLLEEGATFVISTTPGEGTSERVSTTYQGLPNDVQIGDTILLSDGLIQLRVIGVRAADVVTEVVHGGLLAEKQGISLPNSAVSIPAITEKDRADLAFGLEQDVDYIAMSFVRRASDVQELKELIAAAGKNIPVMVKIEKRQALDDLPAILKVTDAVMVARGDLGVEMLPELVPLVQKNLIRAANDHNVTVVTATQMLESMIHHARPTRAEASDVANAIFDGTDAVMLSGETAVGEFPVQAVEMMHRIAVTTEGSDRYREQREALHRGQVGLDDVNSSVAISHAARTIARTLDVAAIVAFTQSGYTARMVSKTRPPVPVLGLTPDKKVADRMALYWGVQPIICPAFDRLDDLSKHMRGILLEGGYVKPGQRVIMTGGHPLATRGATNFIKIVDIE
jgi:pyruvate kinase